MLESLGGASMLEEIPLSQGFRSVPAASRSALRLRLGTTGQTGDNSWQAERRIATWYRAKHREAGRAGPEDSMTSYAVVIERASDGGYGAWCPDLPGCVALADTEEAVLAEMRQAIELHLAGLREDGQPIPHPSTVAATVITLDAA
jgi:predicted RNase H-like HicB family nuclease